MHEGRISPGAFLSAYSRSDLLTIRGRRAEEGKLTFLARVAHPEEGCFALLSCFHSAILGQIKDKQISLPSLHRSSLSLGHMPFPSISELNTG